MSSKIILSLIAIVYTVIVGLIMLHAGGSTSLGWFFNGYRILIFLWVIGPLLLLPIFSFLFHKCSSRVALVVFQILVATFALLLYYGAFYDPRQQDSLAGLVFTTIPFFQYIAVLVFASIVKLIEYFVNRSKQSEA